jgi:hypothetical protein
MPSNKARITVDLPPELRRQLKAVAAALDKTMRELVTDSVRRDLAALQRQVALRRALLDDGAHQQAAPAFESAQPAVEALTPVNETQLQAAQHLTEPLRQQMTLSAERVAEAVRASQQQAIELAMAQLAEQLAALGQSRELRAAADRIGEQHRATLQEALDRLQQTYLDQLRQLQESELQAVRRQLEPFARDWESEADSVYDDLE